MRRSFSKVSELGSVQGRNGGDGWRYGSSMVMACLLCAGQSRQGEMVKVQTTKGTASHVDPESCVAAREGRDEALTGEGAGRVSSRVIHALVRKHEALRSADAVGECGRPHRARRNGEARSDSARSEAPSTYRITLHGSREISRSPAMPSVAGRIGKPKGVRR